MLDSGAGMILYVYMIKNYTEKKREILKKRYEKAIVAKCKKNLYSNLIDLLMNNLNNERNTMSKVKNYYWDLAEKESDEIINKYVKNEISKDDAIKQLSNVQNIELCGIDDYNVDEVLDMAKSEAA